MSEWAEVQLKDIALKITKGTTPTSLGFDFTEEGINFIKAESVTRNGSIVESTFAKISEKTHDALKRSQIIEQDILVSIAGAYLGKIGLVRQHHVPANTNQAVAIVRLDRSKACPVFVKNFLLSPSTTTYLNMLCPQSAQPNLNLTQLGKVKFRLPSLSLQKKIAAILTAYDDLIEVNKRRIALLENMAEEIYREWFVRLRFPGHQHTRFVKGVPEEWGETHLGKIARFTMGQSPKSEFYNEIGEGLPFHQGVGTYGNRFPRTSTYCSVDGRRAFKGDILFSVRAPVGRLNIADRDMIIGRGLAAIKHNAGMNSYLYYLLKTVFANEDIIGNGSIFNSVGKDELARFAVHGHPEPLVKKFESIAGPIDQQIEQLIRSKKTLTKTRDLLLPRLISGKLSVEELDIQFPPSMQDQPLAPASANEARHA